MSQFHLHLVSDATGETVHSVARACFVQFEGVEAIEHHWLLVRTIGQVDKILKNVRENPGVVMFTIVESDLRNALETGCRRIQVPCISVLDPIIQVLASYLGREIRGQSGRQHVMDAEYFDRIDAMTYTLNHDDGQATHDLKSADIVLVGVSRTSKTPTCIYLANRGMRAANVPVVPDVTLPSELIELGGTDGPLIVGLTKDPHRLVQVRRNRLRLLSHDADTDYVDPETVRAEVAMARRVFADHDWPVIDVTRRSIEETAATILQLYERRSGNNE